MITKLEVPLNAVKRPNCKEKNNETAVYRHSEFADELASHPPDVFTMWQIYLTGYNISTDRPFLGTRQIEDGVAKEYKWETHREVRNHIENFGKGLRKLGLTRQKAIGVFSINRREWSIAEIASYREAFILVALYDTLGTAAIEHIINETEMEVIVASKDKIKDLIQLKAKIPSLKQIISMDENVSIEDIKNAEKYGLTIYTFTEVENLGEGVIDSSELSTADDIATICYTSGTTGVPKGAVLTHANCVAAVHSVSVNCDLGILTPLDQNDVYISYLPMAHVLERAAQGLVIIKGGSIGFYQGSALKLLEDMAELKPTVFVSVPRLLNRIYDKVLGAVNAKGGISSYLFHTAFSIKKANLETTVNHWLYDRLVFKKVRELLGGRVRFMLSGSAPISPEVKDFLKICFSVDVHEGYGQTENYGTISVSGFGNNKKGTVGMPFPCSEIKLVDVPDMNYLSTDLPFPRGEICISGNSVMKGYYKNPEKTAETIDSEGWLHTGDIGLLDEENQLVIIDRLKNIFKLSQGEYIAPEKIEGTYQKHEMIAQAYVHGDSMQSQLVGIMVPDEASIMRWASKHAKFKAMTLEEVCVSEDAKTEILRDINAYGKENDLKSFEQVKALYLTTNEFTVENELLTPTFKLKREKARDVFSEPIDNMYNRLTNNRNFN